MTRWPVGQALILATTLIALAYLAASSQPPDLSVSELLDMRGAGEVFVHGLLVSSWTYDSGTEHLVLSDPDGAAIISVICLPGPGGSPSQRASYGDLLRVKGVCSFEGSTPRLYSNFQDVSVLKKSRAALAVGDLARLWPLLIGDRIEIAGDGVEIRPGLFALKDPEGEDCSIALNLQEGASFITGPMILVGVLRLDESTMALVFDVESFIPLR